MGVRGGLSLMPRAKKPKRIRRDWFVADIVIHGGNAVIAPRKGAKRVVVEILGENIVEVVTPEPQRELRANIGDHLVLLGPDVDEVQDATVTNVAIVERRDRLYVALGYGMLLPTTTRVHVLRGKRAA
jgi:hypothetical protein